MLPVIVASTYARGASTSIAAFIVALIGIGSLVTNIPVGNPRHHESASAGRCSWRPAITVAGLLLCVVNLGKGAWSLAVYGSACC